MCLNQIFSFAMIIPTGCSRLLLGRKPRAMFSMAYSLDVPFWKKTKRGFHQPPFTHHALEQSWGRREGEGRGVGRFLVEFVYLYAGKGLRVLLHFI